ncbi:MAG: type IV secretion system DNA-binding domain-containing protein, partial [Steroidobacteraceae bacterium]
MAPRMVDHGWTSFLFAYLLAALGVLGGSRLRRRDAPAWRARHLLTALIAMIAAIILWMVIGELDIVGLGRASGWIRELSGAGFDILVGIIAGAHVVRSGPGILVHRGTRLVARASDPPSRAHDASMLTFAGHPVEPTDETKHFKLLGTTGTGKSTAIHALLRGALSRGDRAVIADPDGGYARVFYDPARGDVILNPFDPRAHRWDLLAEIIQLHDADQLARSIIPDCDGSERSWRQYARTFLTAVLRQLHRANDCD